MEHHNPVIACEIIGVIGPFPFCLRCRRNEWRADCPIIIAPAIADLLVIEIIVVPPSFSVANYKIIPSLVFGIE
ncbi:hypothetical protein D3C87_2091040 [compost metagenome]